MKEHDLAVDESGLIVFFLNSEFPHTKNFQNTLGRTSDIQEIFIL
jgi:hypothetical protein